MAIPAVLTHSVLSRVEAEMFSPEVVEAIRMADPYAPWLLLWWIVRRYDEIELVARRGGGHLRASLRKSTGKNEPPRR